MATHALYDVDPYAITICKRGANRQRIFLRKTTADEQAPTVLPAEHRLLKEGDDWSVFYCVVAEPEAEEDGGQGSDPGIVDVWKDTDEIRRAAHRFAKNKGYVNAMHGGMAEQGCTVVENAVALEDFTVDGQTIRKGSWYLAIEPDENFRAAVDAGLITGVSLEGVGMREALTKAATMTHERTIGSKGKGLFGMPGAQLPAYIQHVYNDLVEGGKPPGGPTYRLAIGIVKNWAEGKGNVKPDTRAKAVAAIAEWEKLKAQARATPNKLGKASYTGADKCSGCGGKVAKDVGKCPNCGASSPITKEQTMDTAEKRSLLQKLGAALGIEKETAPEDPVLTDDEKAALDALQSEVGTVNDKTPEEDDVDTEKRLDSIEKSQQETTSALASLTGLVEGLVGRLTEKKDEETAPDAAKLKKTLEDLTDTVGDVAVALQKVQADVDTLATGATEQPAGADAIRKTAERPAYDGIL
jgi:hypothetical protein